MTEGGPLTSRKGRIDRRIKRLVGVSVLFGLVALAGLLYLKVATEVEVEDVYLERGVEALDRALVDRDTASWDAAEVAFRRAAGRNLFDPYPIFCVSTTERLRQAQARGVEVPERPDDLDDVTALMVAGQRQRARETLLELTSDGGDDRQAQAALYLRLTTDLEVASRRR